MNTITFADGAWEGRSRSEERAMQGYRRRRVTRKRVPRDRPQPPSARRVAAGRHQFRCRSSSAIHLGIASSSLRELDAVALATNVMVFMGGDTKSGLCINSLLQRRNHPACVAHSGRRLSLRDENLCIVRTGQVGDRRSQFKVPRFWIRVDLHLKGKPSNFAG